MLGTNEINGNKNKREKEAVLQTCVTASLFEREVV